MPASCLCSAPHTPHTPPLYFANTFHLFPLPLHLPWPGDIDMSFLGCTAGRSFFTLANTRFMAHTHTHTRALALFVAVASAVNGCTSVSAYYALSATATWLHCTLPEGATTTWPSTTSEYLSLSLSHSPSPWPALLLIMAVPNDCATPTYAQEIGFLSSSAVPASV